jgi:hypothetical protein
MRADLWTYRVQGDAILSAQYRKMASTILQLERNSGHQWKELRLKMEEWPMSPAGYEYLRHIPFIDTTFLVYVL